MPGDNVSIEVELITPIAMEKTIHSRSGKEATRWGRRVSGFWIEQRSPLRTVAQLVEQQSPNRRLGVRVPPVPGARNSLSKS